MSVFQLPLTNIPQQFEISLAGVNYILVSKWNDQPDAGWIFDLLNATDNTPIVANLPLIVGADLLSGLEYLGIQGTLVVYTDGDDFAVPTLDNLGTESNVYFDTSVVGGT
jgi:hypothetical protein